MRIRSNQIVVAVLLAVGAFVLFAVWRPPTEAGRSVPEQAQEAPAADAFLAEARALSAQAASPAEAVGSLPGVDDDPAAVSRVEVETSEFDMGVISNEGLSHDTFTVYNRGRAPLKIRDITTSCACTKGKIARKDSTILPGESAEVEVTVDPRRIPGFYSRKTLTLFTNDPAKPQVAVSVIANVDPEFELTPEEVDFGAVAKGEPASASILLRQLRDKPVKLLGVEAFGADAVKDVTYSFSERPESQWAHPDKREYEIQIALTPNISPGPFTRYFNVSTNVERVPAVRVPVKGTVHSFYAVVPQYPQRLMLKEAADGRYEGVATVSADRPIQIEDLVYNQDAITVELVPGAEPRHQELHVRTAPGTKSGRLEEEIEFTLRAEDGAYPDRIVTRAFVTKE